VFALELQDVTKTYGDKIAVDRLSIGVRRGEIFGLLGANGAGKTTTMRMVLGLIFPDEGTILYNGKPFRQSLVRTFGYLPEERGLYPKIKVCEQLVYLAGLKGMERREADAELKRWLERFGVPEYYNKRVEELSKGNQQKIQFIAAILHKPDILVLDEAFSGLDPVNVELLKATVKELRDAGTTILFSTHRMEHVEELCQNICILHNSKTVLKGRHDDPVFDPPDGARGGAVPEHLHPAQLEDGAQRQPAGHQEPLPERADRARHRQAGGRARPDRRRGLRRMGGHRLPSPHHAAGGGAAGAESGAGAGGGAPV